MTLQAVPRLVVHGLIVLFVALLFMVVFDHPESALNADFLAAPHMFWNLWHGPDPRNFELARIPSFVPDLLVYGLLDFVFDNFRWSVFLYGMLQATAFVYVGGWLVRRCTGEGLVFCAIAVVLSFGAVVAAGSPVRIEAFAPVYQFNPMLTSLVLLCVNLVYLHSPSRRLLIVLAAGSFLGLLSNKLFLLAFVVPVMVASFATVRLRLLEWPIAKRLMIWVAAGAFPAPLIERLLPLSPHEPPHHPVRNLLKALDVYPGFLAEHPIMLVVCFAIPLIAYLTQPWIAPFSNSPARKDRVFVFVFASVAMAGVLTFFGALFVDTGSSRYLSVLQYWLVLFLAIAAVQLFGRAWRFAGAAGLLVAIAALVVAGQRYRDPVPAIFAYKDALADCIMARKDELGLQAGLAQYWLSRPAMIGTGYTVQVDQLTREGDLYHWFNNPSWFVKSIHDPSKPPPYNFIVADTLPPERLEARYGKPDRIETCGSYTLWIYDDRAALYRKAIEHAPGEVQTMAHAFAASSEKNQ